MRNINLLFSDAKDYLYNEVNRVFIAVILAGVILGYIIYSGNSDILKSNEELVKSNAELMQKMEKLKAQVDFRYFNTTRSLEDIHNVRIDTHYGDVRK